MDGTHLLTRTIYPQPYSAEWQPGTYEFGGHLTMYTGPNDPLMIRTMQELWRNFTMGVGTLSVKTHDCMPPFCAVLSHDVPADLPVADPDYAYTVHVTNKGFHLAARDATGLLHAFFTTLQLVLPSSLEAGQERFVAPHVMIQDRPALTFRGIHLCIFPETHLEIIEKAIKLAGFMKCTHVVLEFWGTLKFDALPELHWPGRSYAKDEIRPLIDLARGMGMQVVPFFNHLGHASLSRERFGRHVLLDQNPRLSLLFEPDGWTWCLSNPDTLALLKAVRDELIELCGPGDLFHLGCDEPYSYLTCDTCRRRDGARVFADFINGIAAEMKEQGRRVMIWGDALLRPSDWQPPICATGRDIPDALSLLDRDIVIADWQYSIHDPKDATRTPKHFMDMGFDTVLCPWHVWPNVRALNAGAKSIGAMGVLATTWHHLPEYIGLLPSSASLMWGAPEGRIRHTETAAILRKLVPARSYEHAGWNLREVDW